MRLPSADAGLRVKLYCYGVMPSISWPVSSSGSASSSGAWPNNRRV
jgi:hypothetical protein